MSKNNKIKLIFEIINFGLNIAIITMLIKLLILL